MVRDVNGDGEGGAELEVPYGGEGDFPHHTMQVVVSKKLYWWIDGCACGEFLMWT